MTPPVLQFLSISAFLSLFFILFIYTEDKEETKFHISYVDSNTLTKVWWPNDTYCRRFQVKLGNGLRMTYLISFPRSGNTWTRYMIESLTGYLTNADGFHHRFNKNNIVAYKLGFLGELEPLNTGRTILTKAHEDFELLNPEFNENTSVILIVRNPKHSIKSFWSFMHAKKNEKFSHRDDSSLFYNQGFHKFVKKHIGIWSEIYEERILKSKNLLLIFYEELVEDPITEVKKMLRFLNVTADQERLQCLKKHLQGPAKRTHDNEFDPYDEEEIKLIQVKISSFVKLAKSRGHEVPSTYIINSFHSRRDLKEDFRDSLISYSIPCSAGIREPCMWYRRG